MLLGGVGEDEAFEGSGGAGGKRAEGADEVHIAADVEAFDGDDADGAEAQFFADSPLGDETGAQSGFDGGDDGDDGVEVHDDAEIAEAEAGVAKGKLDDAARAGAAFAHEERDFGEGAHGDRRLQFRQTGFCRPRFRWLRSFGPRLFRPWFLGPRVTAADDENEAVL